MQRKLVYSGGIQMCGGFAVFFDVLWALPLLGFSAAPLMKVLAFIVCAASLSLSVCFSFPLIPTIPYPGGDLSFVSFGSSCPWPFLWGSEPGGASAPVLLALLCPVQFLTPGQVSWERSCSPGGICLPTVADCPTWGRAWSPLEIRAS